MQKEEESKETKPKLAGGQTAQQVIFDDGNHLLRNHEGNDDSDDQDIQGGENREKQEGDKEEQIEMGAQDKQLQQKLKAQLGMLLKNFMQFINSAKQGENNVFAFAENAPLPQPVLYQLLQRWTHRSIHTQKMLIDLHFPGISLESEQARAAMQKISDQFPSVRFFCKDDERIESKGLLQTRGDYFYEGTDKLMRIYSQSKQTLYIGQVSNYEMHGSGILISSSAADNYRYQGQFDHGSFHGTGRLIKGNYAYEGRFQNDFRHGQGRQMIWKNRKKAKEGKSKTLKKSTYAGEYKAGMKCGVGKEITSHGIYEGEWKDDMKHGKGTMQYKNGDHYEGEWVNNEFCGEGKYTEKDNCVYHGEFRDGKYHGKGAMEYCNGDRYQGEYERGLKHGAGTYTWTDGDYYDGEWKRDSADGRGTSMMGADFYDGEFKNGKKHGEGELTDEEGDMTRGIWEEGMLKQIIEKNGELYVEKKAVE